jgi:hypothetical protein
MKFTIRTIPHEDQAYDTVGDYEYVMHGKPESHIEVFVSNLGDERMEFLVAIHELIEAGLMHFAGIPLRASTDFDIEFEAARNIEGGSFEFRRRRYPGDAEPGDSPDAPYKRQHTIATAAERMLAAELGVDWHEYTQLCEKAGAVDLNHHVANGDSH